MAALAGDLDTSFSGDGKATTDFGATDVARGVAIQSDGRIVVVGDVADNVALARYNPDGSLDTSFGNDATPNDGKVITDVMGVDFGRAVVIQPDQKIVVAVQASNNVALARYNEDGSPDMTFGDGNDGEWVADLGGTEEVFSVGLDGTNIVVACERNDDFLVSRHLQNGDLDGTFNPTTGWVTTDFGGGTSIDSGRDLLIQSGSRILVGGFAGADFALARYTATGSLDMTFGNDATPGDGKALVDFGDFADAQSVALAPGGRIVAAGSGTGTYAVARLNDDGSPDNSFSMDGKAETPLIGMNGAGRAVVVQADGKILLAGQGGGDFSLIRYNVDGSLDGSFSGDGMQTTNFSGSDSGHAMAIQGDGRVVVAGESGMPGLDFALARYLSMDDPVPGATGPVTGGAKCAGTPVTRVAGARSTIAGTPARDVIVGTAGRDTIRGRGGNDVLCGGTGKDRLIGGPGNDILRGEQGKDKLIGGKGKDRLIGGAGKDTQRQ